MKPAPPVTSNLGIADLSENCAKGHAPVNRPDSDGGQRAGVQHTVARPARGRWVLLRSDGYHLDIRREQADCRGLFSDRNGKIIPASDAGIRPVVYSSELRQLHQTPDRP